MEFWKSYFVEHASQELVEAILDYLDYHLEIINLSFNLETPKFFQISFDFDKFQQDSFVPVYGILIIF
jgi:predicted translin family RNA/ssDNA-binding protein